MKKIHERIWCQSAWGTAHYIYESMDRYMQSVNHIMQTPIVWDKKIITWHKKFWVWAKRNRNKSLILDKFAIVLWADKSGLAKWEVRNSRQCPSTPMQNWTYKCVMPSLERIYHFPEHYTLAAYVKCLTHSTDTHGVYHTNYQNGYWYPI